MMPAGGYGASPAPASFPPRGAPQFDELLQEVIEQYRALSVSIANVGPTNQAVVSQKISQLIQGLRHLDNAKTSLGDLQVPFEVVQYVDQGLNPQGYTKDCMEKAIQKNEEVKGKIDALKKFKYHLLVELSKAFPGEMSKFRTLRGETPQEKPADIKPPV